MLFENMLLGASRGTPIEEVFTSDAVWVAPAGVEMLADLELTGGTGTSVSWLPTFVAVADVAGGNDQSFSLDTLNSHAEGEWTKFSGLGSTPQSISGTKMQRFANNFTTNGSYSGIYRQEPGDTVRKAGGTASGWGLTGTWNPGDELYDWQITGLERQSGTDAPGGDTTGFGYTANGGGVGEAGETVAHENVPVVPAQSYNLVIPSGGQIVIRYFA